jgi:hypothetical protein
MLGLRSEELPLEILRLGYALKTVPVEKIRTCSLLSGKDALEKHTIALALGMRMRPLRSDYLQPALELFECTPQGLPKTNIVHELFIHTRRSGSDELVGPLVSRWLRLQFASEDTVYVLPVSGGSAERSHACWIFHSLESEKICVVTANPTKFYREHKNDEAMTEYPFQWLKNIPGHYLFLTSSVSTLKPAWLSPEQIKQIAPKVSKRAIDCLTGASSNDNDVSAIKVSSLLPTLKLIHTHLNTPSSQKIKTSKTNSSASTTWSRLQDTNLFDSKLIQMFSDSKTFLPAKVQHEMMASLTDEVMLLERMDNKSAAKFLQAAGAQALSSDEVAEALATVIKEKIRTA